MRGMRQIKMNKIRQDKKLLFRIKKKDREAFVEAYDLYVDDMHAPLLKMVKDYLLKKK